MGVASFRGRFRAGLVAALLAAGAACGLQSVGSGPLGRAGTGPVADAAADEFRDARPLGDVDVQGDVTLDVSRDSLEDVAAMDGTDGTDGTDAGPDGCAGLICNGACLVGASSCAGCTGATLLCKPSAACVAGCETCRDTSNGTALPIECYVCDVSRQNPVGSCEANDPATSCLNMVYDWHCSCAGGVAGCPGRMQVCATGAGIGLLVCITCGETGESSNTLACRGGGHCNSGVQPPLCQ